MRRDDLLAKLARVFGERLVRVERRPRHADLIDGYVVGVGTTWLLIARIASGGALTQGWIAVRLADVTAVRRLGRRTFRERFARSTEAWPPRAPEHPVDLDSARGVLTSMSWNAPLIGFEQEHRRSALWIGRLLWQGRRRSAVLEVDPRARWKSGALGYRRRRMTAVSIGGDYLDALAATAGPPPEHTMRRYVEPDAELPDSRPPDRVLRVFFDWGREWPLWETGSRNLLGTPEDYGFSPAAQDLMRRWREAWVPVADPDRVGEPSAEEHTAHRRAAAAAIRRLKREAPDGVVVDACGYPAP